METTEEIQDFDYEIADDTRRPRKWCAGVPLASLEEVDAAMRAGRMLWLNGRAVHAAWVANLPYSILRRYLLKQSVKTAFTTYEYADWLRRELHNTEEMLPF